MTPTEILALPMDPEKNDARADSVKGYLVALLAAVWEEQEGFSGKRPFGNSGWEWELMQVLVKEGIVKGKSDEYGYLESCDEKTGRRLIREAIQAL